MIVLLCSGGSFHDRRERCRQAASGARFDLAYRKQLLERLGIPFTVAAPNVDESPLPGESASDLVGVWHAARRKSSPAGTPQPW
jgi:hypothetical protein